MRKLKKIIIAFVYVVSLLMIMDMAWASMISFIYYPSEGENLQGVDGDTSGWSSSDSMVNLGTSSWSILGGAASVNGYTNGSAGTLTHRGTRGLGVYGQEDDEIDSQSQLEKIEVIFNVPHWLNYVEVRSLFYEPNLWTPGSIEEGDIDFYLGGSNFYNQHLVGSQDIRLDTKGIVSFTYNEPKLVDKLTFYIQEGCGYSLQSEFAVAKLDVAPIPEPQTILLLGIGLMGVIFLTSGRICDRIILNLMRSGIYVPKK